MTPLRDRSTSCLSRATSLTVYAETDIADLPHVSINGAVRKPGSYILKHSGMRVSDLVYEAGGVKESTYLNKAEPRAPK